MSDMTNYLESKLINHALGKASFTMPTNTYLALLTADPGEAGSIAAEVPDGVGYARQSIRDTMSLSSGGSTSSNTGVISFGPCIDASWNTITHVGIMDAASGGNMLFKRAMTISRTVGVGDSLQFGIGQLTLAMS